MYNYCQIIKKLAAYLSLSILIVQSLYAIGEVELDVHAVGQGNCITIKVPKPNPTDKEKFEYMIVDLGSSSYSNEKTIKKTWIQKTHEAREEKKANVNIQPNLLSITTPESEEKRIVQPRTVNTQVEGSIRPKLANKLVRWLYGEENVGASLKEALEENRLKESKVIKTVIITHPDADHNNLLEEFMLTSPLAKSISIENLILGGLPKRYISFSDMFDKMLGKTKDMRIYFPATGQYYTKGMDLSQSFEEAPHFYHLSPKQQQEKSKEEKLYAEMIESLSKQNFPLLEQAKSALRDKTSPLQKKTTQAFAEAFNFEDKSFKVSCLCANALHTEGKLGRGLRIADDASPFTFGQDLEESETKREHLYRTYNNADSIVLKLEYYGRSAILTGDATQIVTNRIADNYADDKEFLHTDVLIAGHHGSYSHGSNNPAWVGQTLPRYVLVSNGTMYGHPYAESHESFKTSERIEKKLPPHYVLVTRISNNARNKTYDARLTYKGIYSTLSNGNIRILFSPKEGDLGKDKIEDMIVERLDKESKLTAKVKKPKSKGVKEKEPPLAERKIKKVVKGVNITLNQDPKKLMKEEEKGYQSGEETTEIPLSLEFEDYILTREFLTSTESLPTTPLRTSAPGKKDSKTEETEEGTY